MDKEEIKNAVSRYNNRLIEFGETEKALGWGDKGRSKLRYKVLCEHLDIEGSTVLDFGCGFGDLYKYIAENITKNFTYLGIDINENLLDVAKKRYSKGNMNVSFFHVNTDLASFLKKESLEVDYIVSSGIFNFKLKDNKDFITSTLDSFFEISRKGFATNYMSDQVDFKAESNFHSSPGATLALHYKYSNNIIFKNNYMPFEFTVVLNKDIEIDSDLNVYKNFVKAV
jgi:cyclopropane fatty-acyl-phospholipid synthase-like methyltransferase